MWKRWRSLKDQDQEGTFAYKKEEENTNFEDFEEIQDYSSSNTAMIFETRQLQKKIWKEKIGTILKKK